jgi:predicted RNA-binding protein YlxR (DUF448 family)
MMTSPTIPLTPHAAPDASPRPPRGPVRTCAGCQERFAAGSESASAADAHVRVVIDEGKEAEVAVDFAGSSFGRGAHVHLRPSCLERACRGGFARSFKRPVRSTPKSLARQIVQAADQRIRGLLLGARRAKLLAFGEEARDAMGKGKASLAIVAVDAGNSGTKGALLGAVADGRAIAFGTKADLGALFGREEVAVVAVIHEGVARQIHCARAAADAVSALARESK